MADTHYGYVENYFDAALKDPIITASTVIVRRELFEISGGFPVGVRLGEDLALWAKLSRASPLFFQPATLATYRLDGINNTSVSLDLSSERLPFLNEIERLLDEGEKDCLNYYVLYMRKNAYKHARSGRIKNAFQLYINSLIKCWNARAYYKMMCSAFYLLRIVSVMRLHFNFRLGKKK